ncbi:MAG: BTAD domain-containing putative transcriptional regulator [Chloroflexota bacterium]
MQTFGSTLDRLDEELFVGRRAELDAFERWLSEDSGEPALLNVYGPGGVGKSALLRAFAREGARAGRSVAFLDGRNFRPSPEGLLQAFGGGNLDAVVERVNGSGSLVLLDTFEVLGRLTRYLQEQLLPRLSDNVRIVIAGRYPMGGAWRISGDWLKLIRPLRLVRFAHEESRGYLRRRRLTDSNLVEQVIEASGGHPLALSLAADLVVQLGVRDIAAAPEWHLIVRSLVEQLLREVPNRQLRRLVEACAVVRHFDEATLAAISDQDDSGVAFGRLCQLSFVRPTEQGLMMHDDVRRILAQDLRWRRPDRYNALRLRALAHYRERARTATPSEREWLVAERLSQWEDGLVQALLFQDDEPGTVWLDRGTPQDGPELERIWRFWLDHIVWPQFHIGLPGTAESQADHKFFEAMMAFRGTRLGVARDPDGTILGFNSAMPVCQEAEPVFALHPLSHAVVSAFQQHAGLAELPRRAADSNIFYFFHLAHLDSKADAVRAALIRSQFGVFALSGIYLVATPIPFYKKMFEALGFQLIPGSTNAFYGAEHPSEAYVLDLSHNGVEGWIEGIVGHRKELHIQLLGGFKLTFNGQATPETAWRLRKAKSLLKLLALAPGRQLHREQIMDALWPDMAPREAANNFHQALHAARQALASLGDADAPLCQLTLRDQTLHLECVGVFDTDVDRFERASSRARASSDAAAYRGAASLYTGELLPEDRYEEWCAGKRDELRDRYIDLLSELARLYEARADVSAAIATQREVLAADPTREGAHAALMRLYTSAGREDDAARQHQQLERMLREDVGIEPEESRQHPAD